MNNLSSKETLLKIKYRKTKPLTRHSPRSVLTPSEERKFVLDQQATARAITESQTHLVKLRQRIQVVLSDLPENGERELYHVAFKLTDGILIEAREWLIKGDLAASRDCVSKADSLINDAQRKIGGLIK